MSFLIIGFCSGLIPALVATLIITRKSSAQIAAMRERLAAEEASLRHFMEMGSLLKASLDSWIRNFFTFHFPLFNCAYSAALMHQEQKRLEVELARSQFGSESLAA
ncbi:MAG: hypothetical protein RLZZ408_1454 [Verrucomicrobiota bacterium]|jgi:hypothetical protein